MQHGGNDPPTDEQHQAREKRQLAEGEAQTLGQDHHVDVAAFQHGGDGRQQHQHQHHLQVLHHQPADGDLAASGFHQPAVLQGAHHHHGGGDRKTETEHQPLRQRPAQQHAGADAQRGDGRHLQGRARDDDAFDLQ